ncbi:bifunctional bis(5'-adenosyl)-triphosphatase/adenylylsulfatase FHIT isoform X1 [Neltuma alba]|uniref:bifunctional bis(5'-adenosyl)-triphosphatase/adenylylsulfatase FHIT-like n=1 Tax=Neltuma alba TaxID=207710 RepID=UPI0010A30BA3|nr:bifunctional bis(5'-adenosyl)-triphosphatase/adenylylsulfatase FHIT-like [Prosopis alba]XP_028800456.1 bifunctional bis(5'-adenosyl)-triphosphatase/adenylylsulfatase FHIT-like isoform X1 [Prosopis alba]XP_028800459.1 bifunctional bis(5'-adenosyl)-triphosphatase/adenylylsulfatase FHIT-like isoform X1 [Prosopis alba]
MAAQYYHFGRHQISESEVFYTTQLSFALVNNRPVRPGHVLVCPKREVKRVADLTADETCDLWITAQKIGRQLESYHNASSLTFGIQDGPEAGQTVPHVHIHIIPRTAGDFENNDDDINDEIDLKEKQLKRRLDEEERQIRSLGEMAAEADEYRKLFQ